MSLVIALRAKNEVWMASDSAACDDDLRERLKEPKHFRKGEFLIGCCGTMRLNHVFEHLMEIPDRTSDQSLMNYIVKDVVESIRKCAIDYGCTITENGGTQLDGSVLLGYQGHIFGLSSLWQITYPLTDFLAIGSGAKVAYGSLYGSGHLDPHNRLHLALNAATAFITTVGAPYHITKL